MIALAEQTAYLLNHNTGEVKPVDYDGHIETLRKLLGVKYIDAEMLDKANVVFYDDEFRFNDYKSGFKITYNSREITFLGSGLITGDYAGQNAPLKLDNSKLKIEFIVLK